MTDEKNDSLLSRLIRWLDDLLFYEDEEDEDCGDYDVHVTIIFAKDR